MTLFPMFNNLPTYLANTQYKLPKDLDHAPFGAGMNFDGSFFAFLGQHPEFAQTWNEMMAAYTADVRTWLDFYPVAEMLPDVQSDDHPLLVDVGGGLGQDIERFRKRFPTAKGKVYLQDKPDVIEKARQVAGVQNMAHDFFTPQPVKGERAVAVLDRECRLTCVGARAYYFHSVLHDWPDDKVLEILNIKEKHLKQPEEIFEQKEAEGGSYK